MRYPPHELFPWEYAVKRKPPQTPGIAIGCPRSCFPALCVATGLSCDGDSLDRFTYATSTDVSSS